MIKLYKDYIEITDMIIINKDLKEVDCIEFSSDYTFTNTFIVNNDFIMLNGKKFIDRFKIKLKLILQIIKL